MMFINRASAQARFVFSRVLRRVPAKNASAVPLLYGRAQVAVVNQMTKLPFSSEGAGGVWEQRRCVAGNGWLSMLAAGGLIGAVSNAMSGHESNETPTAVYAEDTDKNEAKDDYVKALSVKLQQIRSKSLEKLKKISKNDFKKLEIRRKVNVTKDAPYMVSFEVVNLFDVLTSLLSNKNFTNIRFRHTDGKQSGDDILVEAVVDDRTSFIFIKNKESGSVRLQLYTENVPDSQQLEYVVNAYDAAWGAMTSTNNGWGKIFQDSQFSHFASGVNINPLTSKLHSQQTSTMDNNVKQQLESLGVSVYEKASKTSRNGWSDLAGYEHVKREIDDTVLLALKHPEEYVKIAKKTRKKYESNNPKAILFDGPPGTGKTTTARIIASETDVPLIYVPIESVMSKWYGEGEKTLAKIFDLCNMMGNSIVFIDEVDALATNRNDKGMHEATRRLLSVLLRRIDGFQQEGSHTLTICATNRKEDLDPALISRFDLTVNFKLPSLEERSAIFQMYAKQLDNGEINQLASLSSNMAGRDIRDVCLHAERKFASLKIRGQVQPSRDTPTLNHYKEALLARRNCNSFRDFESGGSGDGVAL